MPEARGDKVATIVTMEVRGNKVATIVIMEVRGNKVATLVMTERCMKGQQTARYRSRVMGTRATLFTKLQGLLEVIITQTDKCHR